MAAVAKDFFVRKACCRFCAGLRLCGCGHCVSLLLQIPIRLRRTSRQEDSSWRFPGRSRGLEPAALNTAARDGRNNANRIAILRGRVLLRQITNVLIVDVHIDEAAQLAVFGKEMFAEFGEFRGQMTERFADSPCTELGRI